jgi:hypothetical protein
MSNYIDKLQFSKYKDYLYSLDEFPNSIILGFPFKYGDKQEKIIYFIQLNKDVYNDSAVIVSKILDNYIESAIDKNNPCSIVKMEEINVN